MMTIKDAACGLAMSVAVRFATAMFNRLSAEMRQQIALQVALNMRGNPHFVAAARQALFRA